VNLVNGSLSPMHVAGHSRHHRIANFRLDVGDGPV
jgi:hypothetical protein